MTVKRPLLALKTFGGMVYAAYHPNAGPVGCINFRGARVPYRYIPDMFVDMIAVHSCGTIIKQELKRNKHVE